MLFRRRLYACVLRGREEKRFSTLLADAFKSERIKGELLILILFFFFFFLFLHSSHLIAYSLSLFSLITLSLSVSISPFLSVPSPLLSASTYFFHLSPSYVLEEAIVFVVSLRCRSNMGGCTSKDTTSGDEYVSVRKFDRIKMPVLSFSSPSFFSVSCLTLF